MKYMIISDIHGNLEALQSVLEYVESNGLEADKVVCLGDVVGYGADPEECIRMTREVSDIILAGNHDFAICGKTNIENFNYYAREAVQWSRNALNKDELKFLGHLPLKHQEEEAQFVHASLHRPESWKYILSRTDTHVDFQVMEKGVLFVGHTHVPVVFEDDGRSINVLNSTELSLSSQNKYIINPGSVGQPRDGDPRASFAIYDSSEKFVKRFRIEYDIKKAQEKILNAGLPEILATRLNLGK